MLFIREDIPSKLLSIEKNLIEASNIETNLRKIKWLLCCSHTLNKENIQAHLENLDRRLILCCYDNHINLGEFKIGPESKYMETSNFKEPTCFKDLENPSCIDLIFTNRPPKLSKFLCYRDRSVS